jgi:cellulose biosynthesis protein BcsQ
MNTFVIVNTKGGVGKSILASQVLPSLFREENKEIKVYELDDNNKTFYQNSRIEFKTLKTEKSEDVIDDVYFDLELGEDVVNIIDSGGGNDTIAVLNAIKKAELQNLTYFIPVNDDFEQFENTKSTIHLIRDFDKNSKIYLVFNRVFSFEIKDITNQFIVFFGSEEYDISGRFDEISNQIEKKILMIQNTQIFSILKNVHNTTLYDFYHKNKDLIENPDKHKKEWVKEGKDYFKKQMKHFRFAKDVFDLIDYIDKYVNFLQVK